MSRRISALLLTTIFVIAPLAGCFGDEGIKEIVPSESFQVDFVNPEDAILRSGEFHDFTLEGEGNAIMTEPNVLIFINGTYAVSYTHLTLPTTIEG